MLHNVRYKVTETDQMTMVNSLNGTAYSQGTKNILAYIAIYVL